MTQQELPVQKKLRKPSRKAVVALVLAIVLLVCSIAALILGTTARHRRETAMQQAVVRCAGTELTNRDLGYYYWSEYFYFVNAVGENLPGFDASVPPDEQMYDDTRTWQDYFIERTLITVRDTVSMALAAREAGFELPEDYRAAYERVLSQFDEAAAEQGFDGVEDYLRASFGPNATRESFAAYLYNTHLAAAYADALYDAITPTDAEIEDYRRLHEADYTDLQQDEALLRACEDLRAEQYQNVFFDVTEDCAFEVNYAAITLCTPEGLF